MMDRAVNFAALPTHEEVSVDAVTKALAAFRPKRDGDDRVLVNGFQVRLTPTSLPPTLDWTFASSLAPIGTFSIVIEGALDAWMGRVTSPALLAATGIVDVGPSLTHDRFIALTELTHALAPLATAVVQPLAGFMASPAAAFAIDATEFLVERNPLPLWAYPLNRIGRSSAWLETTGMAGFGLPELALPVQSSPPSDVESAAFALMRWMLANGPLPLGTVVGGPSGALRVDANIFGALWCAPVDGTVEPTQGPVRVIPARAAVARKRAMAALLGPHTHRHVPQTASDVAQEHFWGIDGEALAMTNGTSDVGAEDTGAARRPRVEFVVHAQWPATWVSGVLSFAARAFHTAVSERPWRALDRVAFPTPVGEIAGILLWPFGHLNNESNGRIELLLLLPLTVLELSQFRERAEAQMQWIEARERHRDVEHIERRWGALNDAQTVIDLAHRD